jgi:MoxR-like ATPase
MTPQLDRLHHTLARARAEAAKVLIGQQDALDASLIVILANQHALIEGVPGVAKTLLVRTLAALLATEFQRIQFTPDLMPADITGVNVYNPRSSEWSLLRGPIFTTFLLADEINRAPAKTQSALLQAMQERCVSIDRSTHQLAADFTVFATQNPIEHEGAYPLPEAQKDRFMLRIPMNFPEREDELVLATRMLGADSPELALQRGEVQAVLDGTTISELRTALRDVQVRPELLAYIVDLVRATRTAESVQTAAGPRATQSLLAAARAHAALQQRDFITPDDVKQMAKPVLEHRLILRPEYEIEGLTTSEVVQQLLESVSVPV